MSTHNIQWGKIKLTLFRVSAKKKERLIIVFHAETISIENFPGEISPRKFAAKSR